MVQYKVATDGMRLDQIVYAHYGDLTMFDAVIQANPSLTKVILTTSDVINLPAQKTASTDEKLW